MTKYFIAFLILTALAGACEKDSVMNKRDSSALTAVFAWTSGLPGISTVRVVDTCPQSPDPLRFYPKVDTVIKQTKVGESKLTWGPRYGYDEWGTTLEIIDSGCPTDCPDGTRAKIPSPMMVNADIRGSQWYHCIRVDTVLTTTWLPKVAVYLDSAEYRVFRKMLEAEMPCSAVGHDWMRSIVSLIGPSGNFDCYYCYKCRLDVEVPEGEKP